METLIKNQAIMNGLYEGDSMMLESTIAEVTLVDGLTATKTASRTLWASGYLTYTVTVENKTTTDFETPVFTDNIDPLISIVPNSVMVGGVTHAYTFAGGVLSINLPTIIGGETLVITFQVQKV